MKNRIIATVLLLGTWGLLSPQITAVTGTVGLAVSLAVTILFASRKPILNRISLAPKSLLFLMIYPFVFMKALIIANFDVARRVLSPSLPIRPAIVEVKTRLQSPLGRLVLANSITLTPGTLSVDIVGDSLYIHWIDASTSNVEEATDSLVRGFEKYLEVIYG